MYDELRSLVRPDADRNLAVWGSWRREDSIGVGYPTRSEPFECMRGCASPDASDHVYEAQNNWRAEVSDAVIDSLLLQHKMAIRIVYEGGLYNSLGSAIAEIIVAATNEFWAKASKKGLF